MTTKKTNKQHTPAPRRQGPWIGGGQLLDPDVDDVGFDTYYINTNEEIDVDLHGKNYPRR